MENPSSLEGEKTGKDGVISVGYTRRPSHSKKREMPDSLPGKTIQHGRALAFHARCPMANES